MQILALINGGATSPMDVLMALMDHVPVYRYWSHGRFIDELATCQAPAIEGLLEGPFGDAMHSDVTRLIAYRSSKLMLTDFGRDCLSGRADFASQNPIHHWWGGTLLTNERLWRWDAESQTPVEP